VADEPPAADAPPQVPGFGNKRLIIIGVIVLAVWAFTIHTGSTVLLIIVSVLTALLAGALLWAWRMIRRNKATVGILQGAQSSPEARREAIAKLAAGKDANKPEIVFARAQLIAADDHKEALRMVEPIPLKDFPAAMQDDVSLLKIQIYLANGRTQDARKAADSMNLDNPERKKVYAISASFVAEAWARTGKPKEALALVDKVEIPTENGKEIGMQLRVVRVFAKFAMRQQRAAESELNELADLDLNQIGRFTAPQFRVHPELQKLAMRVAQNHPAARQQAKRSVPKSMRR
jgi:hypothetical protein